MKKLTTNSLNNSDLVITVQFLFLFVSVESALSMGPMFPLFAAEFHLDDTELSLLTGACVMALGFSNFLIVPCSNIFGRRLTSLVFCLLGMASCIWQALGSSYNSILAARVVNGIATATSETLLMQVIGDMLFLHEKGLWTGVYFMGYALGTFIGPIISGNIAQRYGWRSFFWLSLALTCFNFVTILFCFPETRFRRDPASRQLELSTNVCSVQNIKESSQEVESEQLEYIERANITGTGRPSKSQFRLWQAPEAEWKSFLLRDIILPFRLFLIPIILWAALNVAGPANILLFWNLTESPVLSAPPYNFPPSSVGYANFAFVVGGLIGLGTAGPLSDWIAVRATERNNGIREAEMRLPALIPYFIFTVIGIVIGGVGYDRLWNWPVILIVGYGFSGICVTGVPTIAIAYAIDCYKPISGEIMVVATVVKNSCGFAMSYWVMPMAARRGFLAPAMVQFGLTVGPMALGVPIYFFGKYLRRQTRHSVIHSYAD
ncbi:hypothetical protein N7466_003008 [Penicillium verhagenii]|uniref:uncharacterized protein n=1 Tax=Penicillium verhagenii TaxID=1562060 RepID=UPI00254510A8|nr:uncharacterized protein N7466_003008 [Penicillium verhagenii]KAJ5936558.1 hypothetical protein N7466_003008 [Penicillium verhagenii]